MAQLASDSEELHQVVSSILRNLSWRADISSKKVLRDIGCVSALMTCALQATKVMKTNLPPEKEKLLFWKIIENNLEERNETEFITTFKV